MPAPQLSTEPAGRASAPVVGLSERLLGRFHVTGVFWHELAVWYARQVPHFMHAVFIYIFTGGFFLALSRIRRAITANLEPVLGPASRSDRLRRPFLTMLAFARCRSERVCRIVGKPRGETRIEGRENWDAVADGGAILVTAHIGPWDSATFVGISKLNRKVHVVREAEINPRMQEFVVRQIKAADANYVVHFVGDDMLGVHLLEALRKGEMVALQGDRPNEKGRTVAVSLFGKPFVLPAGPAALARASERPLLPVFSFLDDDFSVRTVVRPPITVATTDDRHHDLEAGMARFAAEIEWAIRRNPHQWFCFRQIWS